MSQNGFKSFEDEKVLHPESSESESTPEAEESQHPVVAPSVAANMLRGSMPEVQRRNLVHNIGQNFGNEQVQRMLGAVRRSASSGPEGGPLEQDLTQKIQAERSNGQSLDGNMRREAEGSLGQDLSKVRVHTGDTASELNRQLGAKAFTTGRDIFFGEGESPANRELLLHEATHTVQQGMSETPPNLIGAADTPQEHAAHNASMGGRDTSVQRAGQDEEEKNQIMEFRDPSIQRVGEEEEEEGPA